MAIGPISRSRLTTAVLVAVTAAALSLTGLVLFGGFSVVATQGTSMLPGIRPGTLAVLHTQPRYQVGDIVGYRSATLDTTVLHRIVAVQDGRYVTRGDNNHWSDPDRPTVSDVTGRLLLRVPALGSLDEWLRSATGASLVASLTLLVFALPASHVTPRRKRRNAVPITVDHPDLAQADTVDRLARSPRGEIRRRCGAAAGIAGITAALVLAILAVWLIPGTVASTSTPPDTLTVTYQAASSADAVYPSGRVTTGAPIFLNLVPSVIVQANHTGPATEPFTLTAHLDNPNGWQRAFPLTVLTRNGGTVRGTLNLRELSVLLATMSAETGTPADGTVLAIVPRVSGWSGQATFTVDGTELRPNTGTFTVSRNDAMASNTSRPTGFAAAQTTLGRLLPSPASRWTATGILGVAGLVGCALLWRRARAHPLESRRTVPVVDHAHGAGRTVIDLQDPVQLAQLANVDDLPIFRAASEASSVYFIDDGAVVYRYRSPVAAGAGALAETSLSRGSF